MDPDMIVTGDIVELFNLDMTSPVHMMKQQQRFEWPSMMVFDNAKCQHLTPEFVTNSPMYDLAWADSVGDVPKDWNYCIGYEDKGDPKLWHYTKGIPVWPETEGLEPEPWIKEWRDSNATVSWQELMGQSVHVNHG